jgi:hypothetical protein
MPGATAFLGIRDCGGGEGRLHGPTILAWARMSVKGISTSRAGIGVRRFQGPVETGPSHRPGIPSGTEAEPTVGTPGVDQDPSCGEWRSRTPARYDAPAFDTGCQPTQRHSPGRLVEQYVVLRLFHGPDVAEGEGIEPPRDESRPPVSNRAPCLSVTPPVHARARRPERRSRQTG